MVPVAKEEERSAAKAGERRWKCLERREKKRCGMAKRHFTRMGLSTISYSFSISCTNPPELSELYSAEARRGLHFRSDEGEEGRLSLRDRQGVQKRRGL